MAANVRRKLGASMLDAREIPFTPRGLYRRVREKTKFYVEVRIRIMDCGVAGFEFHSRWSPVDVSEGRRLHDVRLSLLAAFILLNNIEGEDASGRREI